MAARASLCGLILLLPAMIAQEMPPVFIVWNVGQGLWTTQIEDQTCWHFDMGGERAPWTNIMKRCRALNNKVHLSHWDWDHISFVGKSNSLLPNLCRLNWPKLEPSKSKSVSVARVPACKNRNQFQEWNPIEARSSNEASSVVLWRRILMPGDSNRSAEKIWTTKFRQIESTQILVLGHHGSRTSTSRELLTRLPNLKMAIASARMRRYGHPHNEVISTLRRFRVPMLSTEDWGNIMIW